jgi:N4-gp56 family major capsid protein
MATTTTANLAPTTQTAYNKKLLNVAEPNFTLYNHTEKFVLPKNSGRTISMRRYALDTSVPSALTEGTNPALNSITSSEVTATVVEEGKAWGYTSLMADSDAIDPAVLSSIEKIVGVNAALTLDTRVQTEAVANFQNMYAGGYTSGTIAAGATLKSVELDKAAVAFYAANIKPFKDGAFHAIIHPNMITGLKADTSTNAWVDFKYTTSRGIEKTMENESTSYLGQIAGFKLFTSTVIDTTAIGSGGAVTAYRNLFFADEAIGAVELISSGFETVVKKPGSSGINDALNRLGSVGWVSRGFAAKNLDTSAASSKNARGIVYHTTVA